MDQFVKKISNGANTVGAIILALMFIFVTVQVITRAFGGSITFVDELSGYSAIWATFLGIGFALREGRHVRVDLITRKVSPRTESIMFLIGNIACLLFSLIIIWKGFVLIQNSYISQRVTSMLQWPVYILQVAMPLGFIIFALEAIADTARVWKKIRQSSEKGE